MKNLPSSKTEVLVASVMDAEEARHRTDAIKNHVAEVRVHLLEVYTRSGWKSLGYGSWGEYLSAEFPDTSTAYLRRQTHAAILEDGLSRGSDESLVGTHRESHLRPLNETFGQDDMGRKVLSYYLTLDRTDEPIARDFQLTAWEVYITSYAPAPLFERYKAGAISAQDAFAIARALEGIPEEATDLRSVILESSDPDLIPIFTRLWEKNTATWDEIVHSRTVPAFPEPIPLVKATAYNLLAWLDVASAEHRAIARLEKQPYYDSKEKAIDNIIGAARLLKEAGDKDAFTKALAMLYSALEIYEEIEHG